MNRATGHQDPMSVTGPSALKVERGPCEALLELAPDAYFVTDTAGIIRQANRAAALLLGVAQGLLVGKPLAAYVAKQDRKAFHGLLRRSPQAVERSQSEIRIEPRVGLAFLAAVAVACTRDPGSAAPGLIWLVRDTTASKQAEDSLRETREFLAAILDNAPTPIRVTTGDGRLRMANRAWEAATGLDRTGAIGRPITELFPPETARQMTEALQCVLKTGAPFVTEECLETPGGRRRFRTVRFPLSDAKGQPEAVGGISLDITDQKRTEEELRDHQRRLRALASRLVIAEDEQRRSIAAGLHDNVVQTLLFARMRLQATRKRKLPRSLAKAVEEVQAAVEQALHDTREVLFDLTPPILHERGFEASVEWLAGKMASQHGLAVTFHDDGLEKPLDEAIRVVLFRAVRELVINVVKHARAKQATICVRKEAPGIRVEVADDGAGFDTARTQAAGNLAGGFGLFDIRERLDYFGGRIEIESQPGRGTRVTLWAPLNKPEGAT